MKRFTLLAAFVSLPAMAGITSAQAPLCSGNEIPGIIEGRCQCCDPGALQCPPGRALTVASLARNVTAGVSGEIC
jgi:hypothetical protein